MWLNVGLFGAKLVTNLHLRVRRWSLYNEASVCRPDCCGGSVHYLTTLMFGCRLH